MKILKENAMYYLICLTFILAFTSILLGVFIIMFAMKDESDVSKSYERTSVIVNSPDTTSPTEVVEELQLEFNNPDIVGFIDYNKAGICYPILQTTDNSWYLSHDPWNNVNISGSVFLDCDCKSDFSGKYSVIYGHNMNNGSMFGSLDTRSNIGDTFTITVGDTEYTYEVEASGVYEAKDVKSLSSSTDNSLKRVLLVTCYGGNDELRYVVTGVLQD